MPFETDSSASEKNPQKDPIGFVPFLQNPRKKPDDFDDWSIWDFWGTQILDDDFDAHDNTELHWYFSERPTGLGSARRNTAEIKI